MKKHGDRVAMKYQKAYLYELLRTEYLPCKNQSKACINGQLVGARPGRYYDGRVSKCSVCCRQIIFDEMLDHSAMVETTFDPFSEFNTRYISDTVKLIFFVISLNFRKSRHILVDPSFLVVCSMDFYNI